MAGVEVNKINSLVYRESFLNKKGSLHTDEINPIAWASGKNINPITLG